MAYVAPTSRTTGYVVDAATWNQDVVDNVIFLKDELDTYVFTNPTASQTGQSGTITTSETTIASASLTVSGRRPVLIIGCCWCVGTAATQTVTHRLKEGSTTLVTAATGSNSTADPLGLSEMAWIYTPSVAGTYTYSFTIQNGSSNFAFSAGYIRVMEI